VGFFAFQRRFPEGVSMRPPDGSGVSHAQHSAFRDITGEMGSAAARHHHGVPVDALIRTPLKELAAQLDPAQFVQVHRSVVINLSAVSYVLRGPNETAEIHLKHRSSILKASRAYQYRFRQM